MHDVSAENRNLKYIKKMHSFKILFITSFSLTITHNCFAFVPFIRFCFRNPIGKGSLQYLQLGYLTGLGWPHFSHNL